MAQLPRLNSPVMRNECCAPSYNTEKPNMKQLNNNSLSKKGSFSLLQILRHLYTLAENKLLALYSKRSAEGNKSSDLGAIPGYSVTNAANVVFLLDCSRGMSPWFNHAALRVVTRVRKRSQSHASHGSKFSSVPLSLQPPSLNPHRLCWRTNCDLIVKMCFLKPNSQIFGSRRTPCSALTNTHVRDTDVIGELDRPAEHSFWRPDCSGFFYFRSKSSSGDC